MRYVSERGRSALLRYQYRGRDCSLVYRFLLTPMNNVLIQWIPMWMAPNLVTVTGVAAALVAYATLAWWCPALTCGAMPGWLYVLDAVCTFIYQTLDNLDGKQARRTGSSSPLGLLFDHGCDAFNTTVGAVNQACTMQCGATWKALAVWQLVALPFFFTTLEELYTGELVLPVVNGPTEGILVLCLTKLWTAYAGADWWQAPNVLYPSVSNNTAAILPLIVLGNLFSLTNLWTIYRCKHRQGSFWGVLWQIVPYLSMQLGVVAWVAHSDIMVLWPRTLLWTAGLLFAKMAMHLMLAHLCDEPFNPVRRTFVAVGVVALGLWAARALWAPARDSPMHVGALLVLFAIAASSYVHFVVQVVRECCAILDIHCFTLKKPTGAKQN